MHKSNWLASGLHCTRHDWWWMRIEDSTIGVFTRFASLIFTKNGASGQRNCFISASAAPCHLQGDIYGIGSWNYVDKNWIIIDKIVREIIYI